MNNGSVVLYRSVPKSGPFVNHGSRRRVSGMAEALMLARQAAPDAVLRLIELMASHDERVATIACNSILDRAFGKPRPAEPQPIEGRPTLEELLIAALARRDQGIEPEGEE